MQFKVAEFTFFRYCSRIIELKNMIKSQRQIAIEKLNLDVTFVTFIERSFADTYDIKGRSEISTALEITVWTHLHARHGFKTTGPGIF